jgi:hypothetical protein
VSTKERSRAPVPEWAAPPFHRFLDGLENLLTLLHLAVRGIAVLRRMPRVVEVLHRLNAEDESPDPERDKAQEAFVRAKREASFAEREVDGGFPLLHAQAVVTLWGSLEDLIRAFVALLLQHDPEALQAEAIQRLKVRVGDLLVLDEASRAEFLVEQLDRDISGPLRQGLNRFECVLQPFGLSGDVDPGTKDALFELQNVRNLHAHRQGFVDRRFREACPWLEAADGEYFKVNHEAVHRYSEAVYTYVLTIIRRIGLREGWTPEEIDAHMYKELPRAKREREEHRVQPIDAPES